LYLKYSNEHLTAAPLIPMWEWVRGYISASLNSHFTLQSRRPNSRHPLGSYLRKVWKVIQWRSSIEEACFRPSHVFLDTGILVVDAHFALLFVHSRSWSCKWAWNILALEHTALALISFGFPASR
jgi:hypothetical protein